MTLKTAILCFACLLAGCFVGPSLDRWFGEPQQIHRVCAPDNRAQRAILTYEGQCHIEPVKPWRRTT